MARSMADETSVTVLVEPLNCVATQDHLPGTDGHGLVCHSSLSAAGRTAVGEAEQHHMNSPICLEVGWHTLSNQFPHSLQVVCQT